MQLTATEFRKNLFSILEDVLGGKPVEIVYKGSTVRLTAAGPQSKLARAKRQNILSCDPEAIVHSDPELMAEIEAELEKDWKML